MIKTLRTKYTVLFHKSKAGRECFVLQIGRGCHPLPSFREPLETLFGNADSAKRYPVPTLEGTKR